MKTSATQFEMIVNFMEAHGDLNKPTSNKCARGRIQSIQQWEKLKNLLNADSSGTSKSTEKWKKVWSDLKNNTKRKAAKICKAASGTGGGPALQLKLSELEERILNILGPQAVSGLEAVAEAGFTQNLYVGGRPQELDSNRTLTLTPTVTGFNDDSPSILNLINFSYQNAMGLAPTTSQELNTNTAIDIDFLTLASPVQHTSAPLDPRGSQGSSGHGTPPPQDHLRSPSENTIALTPPARVHAGARDGRGRRRNPARHGQTPQRGRNGRMPTPRRIVTPRRRRRPLSHVEQAARSFINNDESWRDFMVRQHEDNIEIQRQKLRVEERWQCITEQAIATLTRIIETRF